MASLAARHQAKCALGKDWTKGDRDSVEHAGCTCDPAPSFYVIVNLGPGGRRSVAKNRRTAERELSKINALPLGEWEPESKLTFSQFADEWFAALKGPNDNTKRSYVSTIEYAKRAFGEKRVREIKSKDIAACLALMTREVKRDGIKKLEPVSASTQAKDLRVLSSIFEAAILGGHATRNPVKQLPKEHRPKSQRNEAAYFTDDEIAPLLAAVYEHDRPLVGFALATGVRAGELIALRWRNVDLTNRTLYVREAATRTKQAIPRAATISRVTPFQSKASAVRAKAKASAARRMSAKASTRSAARRPSTWAAPVHL